MLKFKFNHLIVLLILVAAPEAFPQQVGFNAVNNLAEFKKTFSDEVKKIHTIKSSFIQEKTLSILEDKIISEGKFWYKREKKVCIEYQRPFRYLLIINGQQMLIRDDQKESRISTTSNKLFQQINRIIVDCVDGTILESNEFSSRVFQGETMYLLQMSPVSKGMKDFFQTIEILVDKNDWSVVSFKLQEPGGDNTLIRFSDKILNEKLDDTLFVR